MELHVDHVDSCGCFRLHSLAEHPLRLFIPNLHRSPDDETNFQTIIHPNIVSSSERTILLLETLSSSVDDTFAAFIPSRLAQIIHIT
jgi:hypothetical protein